MNNQELIAKTVFGEITLGEVLNRFENRISSIGIGPVGRKFDAEYNSWWTEERELHCVGRDEVYERKIVFNLDSKVRVYENHLEISVSGRSYRIVFFETKGIKLDSLLPGAAA